MQNTNPSRGTLPLTSSYTAAALDDDINALLSAPIPNLRAAEIGGSTSKTLAKPPNSHNLNTITSSAAELHETGKFHSVEDLD